MTHPISRQSLSIGQKEALILGQIPVTLFLFLRTVKFENLVPRPQMAWNLKSQDVGPQERDGGRSSQDQEDDDKVFHGITLLKPDHH